MEAKTEPGEFNYRWPFYLPWVPEVSRGPLRDLLAEGRLPTNERRRREKTSGEERFDLLFSLNFDHSRRIILKPITGEDLIL